MYPVRNIFSTTLLRRKDYRSKKIFKILLKDLFAPKRETIITCDKDSYRDKTCNSIFTENITVTHFAKDMKLLQNTSDVPEQTFTIVLSVLASIFTLVIFVDRRRQLPEGFVARVGSFRRIRD